jgi:hypothetical protein
MLLNVNRFSNTREAEDHKIKQAFDTSTVQCRRYRNTDRFPISVQHTNVGYVYLAIEFVARTLDTVSNSDRKKHHEHRIPCFRNNQKMHQLLSVYYFTLLLLHVSATVCHPVCVCVCACVLCGGLQTAT